MDFNMKEHKIQLKIFAVNQMCFTFTKLKFNTYNIRLVDYYVIMNKKTNYDKKAYACVKCSGTWKYPYPSTSN